MEDGENWPISLADRSLLELVEFRANFSGWDVPGILEYFSSFFFFSDPSTRNWTIFSSLSLEPRLWIISEDEFCTIGEVYY